MTGASFLIGSSTTGASTIGAVSSFLTDGSAATTGSEETTGSGVFSLVTSLVSFLPLIVARSLAKGEVVLFFSAAISSSSLELTVFLLKNGREALRLSDLTAGDSTGLVSPAVTVVSWDGTVAGDATEVERGSDDSTAGITGAVSLTGSGVFSLAGTTADSSFLSSAATGFLPNDRKESKIELRLFGVGRGSALSATTADSVVAGIGSLVTGAVEVSVVGATTGAATGSETGTTGVAVASVVGATVSLVASCLTSAVLSSFFPKPGRLPKIEVLLREADLDLVRSFFSSLSSSFSIFFSSFSAFFSALSSAFSSFLISCSTFFSSFTASTLSLRSVDFLGAEGVADAATTGVVKEEWVDLYFSVSLMVEPMVFASSTLVLRVETQLSRSATEAAWKVCL